jgi:hypothetical protein
MIFMDDQIKPKADITIKPRLRAGRVVLGVVLGLVGLGLVLLADTMNLGGFSNVIDRTGVLPICVHDQGCHLCYGPSCLAQPRSTPGPCFGKSGAAATDCLLQSMNYAQPPVRDCRRVLGFMCVELQTGPE